MISGIDTMIFKSHPTKTASTSEVTKDVSLAIIMKNAGWKENSCLQNTIANLLKR